MITYSIKDHIHRFGIWTAARAASKSRLSNKEVAKLIESLNLRKQVEDIRSINPLTEVYYHEWIKVTGNSMIDIVRNTVYKETKKERFKNDNFTFGLAAKIISIYIKTVEVLPTKGESNLSEIAYPPIDSILLKRLNLTYKFDLRHQWSTFDWEEYEKVIHTLKKEIFIYCHVEN